MSSAVGDIRVSRQGKIESITVTGEIDLSNVAALDDALRSALSGTTISCLLDLSLVEFMDSSVVHALLQWSKEAQVSAREGLAIMVGEDTEATRVLGVVGLMKRLPVFSTREAATTALEIGQKPRSERPLKWLTDLELAAERQEAQPAPTTPPAGSMTPSPSRTPVDATPTRRPRLDCSRFRKSQLVVPNQYGKIGK
jgi:anti-anti-sigma factor